MDTGGGSCERGEAHSLSGDTSWWDPSKGRLWSHNQQHHAVFPSLPAHDITACLESVPRPVPSAQPSFSGRRHHEGVGGKGWRNDSPWRVFGPNRSTVRSRNWVREVCFAAVFQEAEETDARWNLKWPKYYKHWYFIYSTALSHWLVTAQRHTDWKACIISFLASAAEWAAVLVFFLTLLCGYKWNLCSASERNALHGADFITAQDWSPSLWRCHLRLLSQWCSDPC